MTVGPNKSSLGKHVINQQLTANPNSNNAILCGYQDRANKSGKYLFVVDIDVESPFETIEQLKANLIYNLLPKTDAIVKTGSGGVHMYYFVKNPQKNMQTANKFVKSIGNVIGVDTRDNGGIVFAPPTKFQKHPDAYKIWIDGDITEVLYSEFNEFFNFIEIIRDKKKTRILEHLKQAVKDGVVKKGNRDNFAFHLAGYLYRTNFSKSCAYYVMQNLKPIREVMLENNKNYVTNAYNRGKKSGYKQVIELIPELGNYYESKNIPTQFEKMDLNEKLTNKFLIKAKIIGVGQYQIFVYDKIANKGYWYRNGYERLMYELNDSDLSHDKKTKLVFDLAAQNIVLDNKFDVPNNVKVFKNKTINVKTLEVFEHSPVYMKTQMIDIEYLPSLGFEKVESIFDSYSKDSKILKQWLAFVLTDKYTIKNMLWIHGVPNTAKSTYANILSNFLGEENTSSVNFNYIDKDPRSIHVLEHSMLNISGELSNQTLNDVAVIKMLTGSDKITVDVKYQQNPSVFYNSAKIMSHGNEFPKIDNYDNAFFERIMIVEFNKVFPNTSEQPQELKYIFSDVGKSELLNLAFEMMPELLSKGFSDTSTIHEKKMKYKEFSEPIETFIDSFYLIGNGYSLPDMVYTEYMSWCEEKGIQAISSRAFRKFVVSIDGISYKRKMINGSKLYVFEGLLEG